VIDVFGDFTPSFTDVVGLEAKPANGPDVMVLPPS
jgi:hypothetical protein